VRAGWGPLRGRAARRSHFSTPGAKATDFSRFGAHLLPEHFSRFDPKVPHFSNQLTSSPGRVNAPPEQRMEPFNVSLRQPDGWL